MSLSPEEFLASVLHRMEGKLDTLEEKTAEIKVTLDNHAKELNTISVTLWHDSNSIQSQLLILRQLEEQRKLKQSNNFTLYNTLVTAALSFICSLSVLWATKTLEKPTPAALPQGGSVNARNV